MPSVCKVHGPACKGHRNAAVNDRAVLERAEFDALVAACTAPDERAVLLLAYDLAMRASEVAGLRPDHVEGRTVYVKRSKNGKREGIGISARTLAAIRPFVDRARSESRTAVFPDWDARRFARWFRGLVRHTGLASHPGRPKDDPGAPHDVRDKGYSHILRRSRATHLIEAGAAIKDVQRRLGHRSVKTTMLYLGLTEERKRAVDDLAAKMMDG